MKTPLLITNFKTYECATGEKALVLAKIHEKIAKKHPGITIAIAVQPTDIYMIASEVSIPVFAQHFDIITHGKNTGYILPEALKRAGAVGSLINHAEHQIPLAMVAESLIRASQVGLMTIACAQDHQEAVNIAALKPDFVAVEPPELIGGDVSISTAAPHVIKDAVAGVKGVPILVGAGVKDGSDVEIGLKLGAKGVLVASGVVQADDPERVLEQLVKPMLV
jgi:triosephosphate isomerase (TIM)